MRLSGAELRHEPERFPLLPLTSYLLPLTSYLLPLTSYLLPLPLLSVTKCTISNLKGLKNAIAILGELPFEILRVQQEKY